MIKMKVLIEKDMMKQVYIEGYDQPLFMAPNPGLAELGITHPERVGIGSLEALVAALAS